MPKPDTRQRVVITDVDIPFFSLVTLLIKLLPALVVAYVVLIAITIGIILFLVTLVGLPSLID